MPAAQFCAVIADITRLKLIQIYISSDSARQAIV